MAYDKLVVLITGANTGLGFEAAKALLASNECHILLGSRDVERGESAIKKLRSEVPDAKSTIEVLEIDVTSDTSIEKALKDVTSKIDHLDVLVNNAGVSLDKDVQDGTTSLREAWTRMWDTNVVGAHIMTQMFVPLLLKSSSPRVVFITSGTSSLAETQELEKQPLARLNASPEAGWPKPAEVLPITGYRSSKTGLNMLVTQWARVLKKDGMKVFAVSPGFLNTGLGGMGYELLKKVGAIDPNIGGEFLRDVIVGKRDDQAGKVIRKDATQTW